jgi:hypothetical protein
LLLELGQHLRGRSAGNSLVGGQVAEEPEQVGDAFDIAGAPLVTEPLQLCFDLTDGVGVEQLA